MQNCQISRREERTFAQPNRGQEKAKASAAAVRNKHHPQYKKMLEKNYFNIVENDEGTDVK